jgi:hypothetical protein
MRFARELPPRGELSSVEESRERFLERFLELKLELSFLLELFFKQGDGRDGGESSESSRGPWRSSRKGVAGLVAAIYASRVGGRRPKRLLSCLIHVYRLVSNIDVI